MSRLDSFIRRMCAQRDILNALPSQLQHVEGEILEFGLGNGRTYDHLRLCFPARRVVVFEREFRSGCMPEPPPGDLVLGDIRETSSIMPDGGAALVHIDINTGDVQADAEIATWLPSVVVRVLAPFGVVASSFPVLHPRLTPLPLPPSVAEGRYYVAQREP